MVEANQNHLEVINEIILASKRHWGYSESLIDIWKSELLMTPDSFVTKSVWLLIDNSEAIGVASISSNPEQNFELEDFWISPDHIGIGAGRFLFEFVINWLSASNAISLKIVADPNAAGFYKRMGASFVGMILSKPEGREIPEFLYGF